jgi:hypothetical protein
MLVASNSVKAALIWCGLSIITLTIFKTNRLSNYLSPSTSLKLPGAVAMIVLISQINLVRLRSVDLGDVYPSRSALAVFNNCLIFSYSFIILLVTKIIIIIITFIILN